MKKERALTYIVFALLIISPLIIISPALLSVDFFKSLTITGLAIAAGLVFAYGLWRDRSIEIPKHPLFIASSVLALVYVIASFFSTSTAVSFFGQGGEVDTASLFLALWLILTLVSILTKGVSRVFSIYASIIIPFVILALFHLLRIVGGTDFLTLGILNGLTASIFGKWYELSLFSGLILTLTVPAFEFLTFRSSVKSVLYIVSFLALILLLLVNFSFGWTMLALAMAFIIVLKIARNSGPTVEGSSFVSWKKKIAPFALVFLVVSIIFAWKGTTIMGSVIDKMAIGHTEVQLPWQATLDIAAGTIKEAPLLGAGPNQFAKQYLRYKPIALNATQFWAVDFSSGVGYVSSGAVTLGLAGIIAWIAFFWVLVRNGVRVARQKTEDVFADYTVISSFVGASFLWVSLLAYTPSHTLLLLTFVMTGVFIGASTYTGLGELWKVQWESKGKKGVAMTVLLTALTLLLIIWGVWEVKMTVARLYYQGGSMTLNDAELKVSPVERVNMAERSLTKATSWTSSDLYQRGLAEIYLLKMQVAINEAQNSSSTEIKSKAIATATSSLESALVASQRAIEINPFNYANYITRAQVSETATTLQVPNGYEATIQAYQGASTLNPYNPYIFLKAGQFESASSHDDIAERYLSTAVQMKRDYTDAIVQLGFLYYKNKAYDAASQAFSQVESINPNYPNIHYYSGILLARMGKTGDALAKFDLALKANPNDANIPTIISTLKAGRSIFSDSATSAAVTPQAVAEKTATSTKATTSKKK